MEAEPVHAEQVCILVTKVPLVLASNTKLSRMLAFVRTMSSRRLPDSPLTTVVAAEHVVGAGLGHLFIWSSVTCVVAELMTHPPSSACHSTCDPSDDDILYVQWLFMNEAVAMSRYTLYPVFGVSVKE